jgi:hypothetical protein
VRRVPAQGSTRSIAHARHREAALAAVAIHSKIRDFTLDCFAEFTPAPKPGLAMTEKC